MAVYEKEGQLTYVDENGNEYILYPKTTVAQVKGLPESLAGLGSNTAPHKLNVDDAVVTGWYQVKNVIIPGFCEDADRWWDAFVISALEDFSTHQFIFDRYGNFSKNGSCYLHRSRAEGKGWGEWEWENPPMEPGWAYRTTKRYKGNAVYEKVDETGNILWRAENETAWHLLASAEHIATATVE